MLNQSEELDPSVNPLLHFADPAKRLWLQYPTNELVPVQLFNLAECVRNLTDMVSNLDRKNHPHVVQWVEMFIVRAMNSHFSEVASAAKASVAVRNMDQSYRVYKMSELTSTFEKFCFAIECPIPNANGKTARKWKTFDMIKIWKKCYYRRSFKSIGLYPSNAPDRLNQWSGFSNLGLEQVNRYMEMNLEELTLIVAPFVKHLEQIWCKNQGLNKVQYLIRYFAHMIQKPLEKQRVAIVVRSTQEGAGKGVIITKLGSMFGHNFQRVLRDDCFGAHTTVTPSCMMLFIDEYRVNRADSSKMKVLISEKTYNVNYKYGPTLSVDTPRCVFIATNDETAIEAGVGARRYFVLELDNRFAGRGNAEKNAYFQAIVDLPCEAIYAFLMKQDLSQYKPENMPLTSALVTQMRLHMHPVEQWIYGCLRAGKLLPGTMPFEGSTGDQKLVSMFREYCVMARINKARISDDEFWIKLGSILPLLSTVIIDGMSCKVLPSVIEARKMFCKYYSDDEFPFEV